MAISSAYFFNNGIYDGVAGPGVNWAADNHYWVLLTSSYTFSVLHDTLSDVSIHECNDADYNPLDVQFENKYQSGVFSYLDCTGANFGNPVTITAKWLVLVKGTTGTKSGLDKILCAWDLNTASAGSSLSSQAGSYNITLPAAGWLQVVDATPTTVWYNAGILAGALSNWTGTSKYAVLLTDAYTAQNNNAHDTYSDVSAYECTDPDYLAQAVTTLSVTRAGSQVKFDLADVTWGTDVSITARWLIICIGNAGVKNAADPILLRFDLGVRQSVVGTFSVAFNTSGVSIMYPA